MRGTACRVKFDATRSSERERESDGDIPPPSRPGTSRTSTRLWDGADLATTPSRYKQQCQHMRSEATPEHVRSLRHRMPKQLRQSETHTSNPPCSSSQRCVGTIASHENCMRDNGCWPTEKKAVWVSPGRRYSSTHRHGVAANPKNLYGSVLLVAVASPL